MQTSPWWVVAALLFAGCTSAPGSPGDGGEALPDPDGPPGEPLGPDASPDDDWDPGTYTLLDATGHLLATGRVGGVGPVGTVSIGAVSSGCRDFIVPTSGDLTIMVQWAAAAPFDLDFSVFSPGRSWAVTTGGPGTPDSPSAWTLEDAPTGEWSLWVYADGAAVDTSFRCLVVLEVQ